MAMKEIIEAVKETPLNEFGEVFFALVRKVYEYRKTHEGYVPREIFEACLGMAGLTCSVQIVNEVVGEDGKRIGFALKKREAYEVSWEGLYHSTCCVGHLFTTPENALGKDTEETFGYIPDPNEDMEFLGATIHYEPERLMACLTVMHRRKIRPEDVSRFVGEWKIFTEEDIRSRNPEIVDNNWYLLEWVMAEKRRPFADVRDGYTG